MAGHFAPAIGTPQQASGPTSSDILAEVGCTHSNTPSSFSACVWHRAGQTGGIMWGQDVLPLSCSINDISSVARHVYEIQVCLHPGP